MGEILYLLRGHYGVCLFPGRQLRFATLKTGVGEGHIGALCFVRIKEMEAPTRQGQ